MSEKMPIVSICCLAYNQEQFIRKALDGFLMQKPPTGVSADESWYEILIHDDCSTDGTDAIIRDYTKKYPDKIFPLYEEINQYSHGGKGKMDVFNYSRARGRYIAYCEGDDYWTDSHKLQKQVDFLDSHPDYSVCWHRCIHYDSKTGEKREDACGQILPNDAKGMDMDLDTYFSRWYTQPLTMVFRREKYSPAWREQYQLYRDQHELYHLLKEGKGYLFAFFGGVYIKHGGGIYTSLAKSKQDEISLQVAEELYRVNKDEYTRRFYANILQWQIYENVDSFRKKWKYSWALFTLNRNLRKWIRNIIRK